MSILTSDTETGTYPRKLDMNETISGADPGFINGSHKVLGVASDSKWSRCLSTGNILILNAQIVI